MCSVVSCDSWRRKTQRFKLPEDPERRLEWVQFLFEVNGQRLKESSWTDITICNEHFTGDCFEQLTPSKLKPCAVPSVCVKIEADEPEPCQLTLVTGVSWVQLKIESVRSLCVKPEPDEPLENPQQVEPLEDVANNPTSSEISGQTLTVPQPESDSPGGSDQIQPKITNIGLNNKTAAVPQKIKHVVNERCLFQLFRRKCPSCGCKLQMEKVTCGTLLTLNQQCLQCEYRNQWKSQVNASVPAAQQLTEEGGTPGIKQEVPTDDNPSTAVVSEIVTFSDEESDSSDEGEEGDDDEESSDGEWNPRKNVVLAEELEKESEEEPEEEEEEEEEEFDSPVGLKTNELCTECGSFFTVTKPHTCEYKIKPFSCNVCGKRCVTETSLKNHSRIHDETYDHPCKFCHVVFKTRVDKLKHEQIHQDNTHPYKCPDCPETFSTNKKRSIHLLANHRTTKEHKCGVCGFVFKDVHHLRRHSVVHTGLKPYKCSVCQRSFNQSHHLKSHMRLHTGERPYKCQHCDQSFNHNVSLKSHVQRYHSASSGREGKKGKEDEKESDPGAAEDRGNKTGTDPEFDNIEEEQDTEEEKRKSPKRSTGRPKGRPKRKTADSLVLTGQKKGKCPNSKTAKSKVQKRDSSDEESEEEQSDSDMSFNSTQEEEEEETE